MNIKFANFLIENSEEIADVLDQKFGGVRNSFVSDFHDVFNIPYWYVIDKFPCYQLDIEEISKYLNKKQKYNEIYLYDNHNFYFHSYYKTYMDMQNELKIITKKHPSKLLMSHWEFFEGKYEIRIPITFWKDENMIISVQIISGKFYTLVGDFIDILERDLNYMIEKKEKSCFTESQFNNMMSSIRIGEPKYAS